MRPVALTGIKPSGEPHLGNLFGAIRPALGTVGTHEAFFFIADAHALTTLPEPDELRRLVQEVAAAWLSCGLDPEEVSLYRQSDVPETFELAWILSCSTSKGVLNRSHAYKAAVEENEHRGRPPDEGVNAGLFAYPVLMAADILAMDADVVPVGRDQLQHVEIARDIAQGLNHHYGEVLTVPEPVVHEAVAEVPGTDGRKMSKSYANTLPILASHEELHRRVMRIVTDSRRPEEPKDPETCTVFGIYRHVAPPEQVEAMRRRYLEGGLGYREVKEELAERLRERFAPARERYAKLQAEPEQIERVLEAGARRARERARSTLSRVRAAVGLDHHLQASPTEGNL